MSVWKRKKAREGTKEWDEYLRILIYSLFQARTKTIKKNCSVVGGWSKDDQPAGFAAPILISISWTNQSWTENFAPHHPSLPPEQHKVTRKNPWTRTSSSWRRSLTHPTKEGISSRDKTAPRHTNSRDYDSSTLRTLSIVLAPASTTVLPTFFIRSTILIGCAMVTVGYVLELELELDSNKK